MDNTVVFWTLAGLMLAVALAMVLPGLVRGVDRGQQRLTALRAQLAALKQKHDVGQIDQGDYAAQRKALSDEVTQLLESPPRRTGALRKTAFGLAVFIVAMSVKNYDRLGTPAALNPENTAPRTSQAQSSQSVPDMAAAMEGLRQRLEANPEDVDGWLLLGRSYGSMGDFASARAAYSRALAIAPEEPMIMQLLGQAIALSSDPNSGVPVEAEMLFEQALERDPNAQMALFFSGFSAMNRGDEATAVERWSRLYAMLDPASDQAKELQRLLGESGIDLARISSTAQPEPTDQSSSAEAGPVLNVSISVAEALRDKVQPGDTLFVFARAAQGPRMPLAIQRLSAEQLPLTITLDNTMGMTPAMSLSTFPEVIVGARVSKSGNATPQPGDLQALSDPIPNTYSDTLQLEISETL